MIEKIFFNKSGEIHYWISNEIDSEKPTLVFLPGLTADHHLFDKQIEYFKDKYNLLVWDTPGHGNSRPYKLDYDLADLCHELYQIVKLEKIQEPFIIGQSLGGYIGQLYSYIYPNLTAGFVSIDSAPLNREYYTQLELELLKHMKPVYLYFPWKALKKIGPNGCSTTTYGRKLMSEMMKEYEGEKLYYSQLTGHGFKILANTVLADLDIKLSCPVLLICGTKDQAGSSKRYNKNWHKKTGYPLKWIKDAGHNANTDQPDIVNHLIKKFVEKNYLKRLNN